MCGILWRAARTSSSCLFVDGGISQFNHSCGPLGSRDRASLAFPLSPPPTPPPSDPLLWDTETSTETEVGSWAQANRAISDLMSGHLPGAGMVADTHPPTPTRTTPTPTPSSSSSSTPTPTPTPNPTWPTCGCSDISTCPHWYRPTDATTIFICMCREDKKCALCELCEPCELNQRSSSEQAISSHVFEQS
jgi:hypothetical protein